MPASANIAGERIGSPDGEAEGGRGADGDRDAAGGDHRRASRRRATGPAGRRPRRRARSRSSGAGSWRCRGGGHEPGIRSWHVVTVENIAAARSARPAMTAARLSTSVRTAPAPAQASRNGSSRCGPIRGGGVADERHDRADHPDARRRARRAPSVRSNGAAVRRWVAKVKMPTNAKNVAPAADGVQEQRDGSGRARRRRRADRGGRGAARRAAARSAWRAPRRRSGRSAPRGRRASSSSRRRSPSRPARRARRRRARRCRRPSPPRRPARGTARSRRARPRSGAPA